MNRIYRLVWNRALKSLQVVSELAHSHDGAVGGGESLRPNRAKRPLFLACATALTLGGVALALPVWAATSFTVTQVTDDGTGDVPGSLSWGIDQANANPGSTIVIQLTSGNVITETGTLPSLNSGTTTLDGTLQIVGTGAAPLVISGTGTTFRIGDGIAVASITGSSGGTGSSTSNGPAGSGGGGGGVVILSSGTTLNVMAAGSALGGAGGTGGYTGNGAGGNGGTGGAGVTSTGSFSLSNAGTIAGGAGGAGGVNGGAGFGGNGGNGGAAVNGVGFTLTNSGTIAGGAGGVGGSAPGAFGGNGGSGGTAVNGSSFTLTNEAGGQINGGNSGGAGGGFAGSSGGTGTAVASTGNSTVINAGSISGGTAVNFSGGGNTLTLEVGSTTTGSIVSASGNTNGGDTLILGDNTSGGGSDSLNIGNVSGFTAYQKTGTSTWLLTGAGSNQDWQLQEGTLQGDATAFAGNITLAPAAGDTAAVVFDQGSGNPNSPTTATYADVISGDGSLSKIDDGTLILTGANSYTGGTTISGGTLQGDTTSLQGNIVDNAALVFNQNTTGTFAGAVSGTGTLTQSGTGTLILTGANSYTGGTTISGGTLQGDTTSLQGNIADNGALVFDQNTAGTFVGAVSGSGTLTQSGTGTLTLSGTNSYTGGTTISGGTLLGDTTSLQGNIVDNAALVFDQNTAGTFAGAISGTGSLTQSGSGVLTLDGNSSAYAGATEIQSGGLIIGSVTGNGAALGGNVIVDSGASLGGDGIIGGNVDVLGGAHLGHGDSIGTLSVNGNLTAAQGSVLDFDFGAPGAKFAVFGAGDSVKVGGNLQLDGTTLDVTDAGGFGAGLYNLFTYAGTLTETNGGITLGSTPAGDTLMIQNLTGSKQINLVNASGLILDFWNGNGLATAAQMGGGSGTWSITSPNWTDANADVSGPVQPQRGFAIFGGAAGTVKVDNSAGAVSATGLQFASNGYTLTGDTLTLVGNGGAVPAIRVGDGSAAGAGYTATIDNVIAGTAGLDKTDLGTLVLTGANTYSGGTMITGGMLSVSADANLGDAGGALTLDGGTLAVTGTTFHATTRNITLGSAGGGFDIADAGNTFTVSKAMSGSGGLTKLGDGTLILSGANSYSGGTTVSGGTLQGDTTSLQGNITVNAALVFNQITDGLFAGTLNGNGSISLSGTGTVLLDGNNTFTGNTVVQAGTLEVGDGNSSTAFLGGNVQIDAGGTLRGHGSIGGNVVNEGTLWPGGSLGTLHIGGNYTQNAGGMLTIDAMPNGQADELIVGGKASLGGSAIALESSGNWMPITNYTILTADGGVTGQFASASSSLVFLTPVLSYTANAVDLSLQRNDISFGSVAQTPNQRAVAGVADSLGFGNPVYSALTTLDAATAQHAFDQLSGVIYATTSSALIDDSRYVRDAINRHLLGVNNDGADAATTDGVSAWTSAWGHGGHNDDDSNVPGLQANDSGLLVGADLPLGADARLGAVLGHGQNSIQSNGVDSSTHVLGDHAGLYGSSTFGAFVLRAGAVYSWQRVSDSRSVAFGTYSDWLTSENHAQTAQAYVEGGYQFNLSPSQQLEPFVNLARVRVHEDALQESGGAAALAVAGSSTSVNTAALGLRDTLSLDAAGGIHAHASLAWQQAWGGLTPITTMRFVDGGDSFAIAGVPVAQHALDADLGIDFKVASHVTVDASYLGQFASKVQDQGARMSLTVTF